jgi:hypothetical protein
MGIPPEFQQQHSSLCLHIWLLLVRLRAEGKDGKSLAQVRWQPCRSAAECSTHCIHCTPCSAQPVASSALRTVGSDLASCLFQW